MTPTPRKDMTFVDRTLSKLKNHPVSGALIILGIGVTAIWAAYSALKGLATSVTSTGPSVVNRIIQGSDSLKDYRDKWMSSFEKGSEGIEELPILDVIVTNNSETGIVVHRLILNATVTSQERIRQICAPLATTWSYNVMLDSRKRHQSVEAHIAQAIPAEGADRFAIIIGQDGPLPYTSYLVTGVLLLTNGNKLPLQPVRLELRGAPCGESVRLNKPIN